MFEDILGLAIFFGIPILMIGENYVSYDFKLAYFSVCFIAFGFAVYLAYLVHLLLF